MPGQKQEETYAPQVSINVNERQACQDKYKDKDQNLD